MKPIESAENLIHGCQLGQAEKLLNSFIAASSLETDLHTLLDIQLRLVRIYAEQERTNEITQKISKIEKILSQEKHLMTSKIYYSRALCAGYLGQFQSAYEFSEKALDLATLEEKNYNSILYALSGIIVCKMAFGKFAEALNDMHKIEVILEKEPLLEVRINSLINQAKILSQMNRHKEAFASLTKATLYIRQQKSLLNHIILISTTGELLAQQGDEAAAHTYFNFAKSLCDPVELPHRYKLIIDEIKKLRPILANTDMDLKIDFESQSAYETTLGEINFKNQFILLDLLKLLSEKKGTAISKEEIVKKVWNEEYAPERHDNKIYVTIKRLKNLIEPDKEKSKYLFRSKNGYFLTVQKSKKAEHL